MRPEITTLLCRPLQEGIDAIDWRTVSRWCERRLVVTDGSRVVLTRRGRAWAMSRARSAAVTPSVLTPSKGPRHVTSSSMAT